MIVELLLIIAGAMFLTTVLLWVTEPEEPSKPSRPAGIKDNSLDALMWDLVHDPEFSYIAIKERGKDYFQALAFCRAMVAEYNEAQDEIEWLEERLEYWQDRYIEMAERVEE
jgi:hypothetical protein